MVILHKEIGCVSGELSRSLSDAKKVLLVTGQGSYDTTNIKEVIEGELSGKEVTRISDFSPNPKLSELSRILIEEVKGRFDAVITVGGGSVIDMGKLLYFFQGKSEVFIEEYLKGQHKDFNGTMTSPLIAIPTTAGTGSESTHFAVLYDNNNTKHSVAHPTNLLPDEVFLDAELLRDIDLPTLGPTILDSLCQCIESYWSIHATLESKDVAKRGLEILVHQLNGVYPETEFSPESKQKLLIAANYSGQAINTSKTTASHAVSYPITASCGLPHGHAVALTIGEMLQYNSTITDTEKPNGAPSITPESVRKCIGEILEIFGCATSGDFIKYIENLLTNLGLSHSLSELGVIENLDYIVVNGFNPQRVINNPRKVTEEALREMLTKTG